MIARSLLHTLWLTGIPVALLAQAPDRPTVDTARAPRRVPVTAAMDRSAFRDSAARSLVLRARAARLLVDSALIAYRATSYRRATVSLGFREVGLEKTLYRQEASGRVEWGRTTGARVTVTGLREASPLAPGKISGGNSVPFPWFPGSETLWIGGSSVVRDEVDETRVVHPWATGSEAYYTYAIGDSVQMSLPGGRTILLRELRVTPRAPKYNVFVGSFWFDNESAQLVRATYRLAAEADLTANIRKSVDEGRSTIPFLVRQVALPLRAELSMISIESSLFEGRFWLPRSHLATGTVRLNIGRLPVALEEKFRYESVNAEAPAPAPAGTPTGIKWDSLNTVPVKERRAIVQRWLKAAADRRTAQCATGPTWQQVQERYGGRVTTYLEVPCDTAALARSSTLPAKMFDASDAIDEAADASAALGITRQAEFAPQAPTLSYGFADGMVRYNRVEGLSVGARVASQLGAGYAIDAVARLGTGDRWLNAEVGLARTNGTVTWRGAAYAKSVSISDWGTPFGLPESVLSALVARDEGFYARVWGGELSRRAGAGTQRLFVEGQGSAAVTTRWSARRFGADPAFLGNVVALEGTWAGVELRERWLRGADPLGGRWLVEARAEGAGGTTSYGRVALEGTVGGSAGPVVGTLTLSAGSAAGTLPPQRAWLLGGARTVRGQVAGTMTGDAFWFTRAEAGPTWTLVRPVLFYDAGWAGRRDNQPFAARPMSGAGIGVTALDGLVRVDLARGIWPRSGLRLDVSYDARF